MQTFNPAIVTNQLVMAWDMYNSKSWKGCPTTNYAWAANPRLDPKYNLWSSGFGGTFAAKHYDAITVISANGSTDITNYINTGVTDYTNTYHAIWTYDSQLAKPVVTQRDFDGVWKAKTFEGIPTLSTLGMTVGSKYVISWNQWVDSLSKYVQAGLYIGNSSSTYDFWDGQSSGTATSLNTKVRTWERVYCVFTCNAAADQTKAVSRCYMYGMYGPLATSKIADVQLELNTAVPTPFCNQLTRTNTQSLYDLTGTNTLTLGAVTPTVDGNFSFPGSGPRITTNLLPTFNDFTVGVWYKATANAGGYDRIVDCLYTTGFALMRNGGSANSWGGGVMESGAPYGIFLTLTDGQWHYLVSVRKGTTHTLYGDGITNTVSNTVSQNTLPANALAFGGWGDGTAPSQCFIGLIGGVQIYSRALAPAEIMQNFTAQRGRYGI